MQPADSPSASIDHAAARRHFARGFAHIATLPALILFASMIGFAGLAKDTGFSLCEALFMTAIVWALPAQVVLIGSILSGATLAGAALAVGLSSVRLMPMVVALLPEMRGPKTRRASLFLATHFIAVTAWVIANEHVRAIPRDHRIVWFLGVGFGLCSGALTTITAVYLVSAAMPPFVLGALFMITPIYFLTSLWTTAREASGYMAIVAGLVLAPLFHAVAPQFDLLLSGAVGGVGAYLVGRARRRRAP